MSARSNRLRRLAPVLLVAAVLFLSSHVCACPACFGETDAKTAEGVNGAIYLMMAMTGGVVGGIAAFFINFRRRAAALLGRIDPSRDMH
jgi:hypothetical protein